MSWLTECSKYSTYCICVHITLRSSLRKKRCKSIGHISYYIFSLDVHWQTDIRQAQIYLVWTATTSKHTNYYLGTTAYSLK
jgi:hypothetical protein